MGESSGIALIIVGLLLAVTGLAVLTGAVGWFGHLPGDIRLERGNVRVFIPISSMVIVSIILSVVINLLWRLFR